VPTLGQVMFGSDMAAQQAYATLWVAFGVFCGVAAEMFGGGGWSPSVIVRFGRAINGSAGLVRMQEIVVHSGGRG
jgi:hypothetical protein